MTQKIVQYLLELTICLGVFGLCYEIFLKRLKPVRARRLYLIAAPILSLFIPILEYMVPKPDLSGFVEAGFLNAGTLTFNELLSQYLAGFEFKVLDLFLLILLVGWGLKLFQFADLLAFKKKGNWLSLTETNTWNLQNVGQGIPYLGLDRMIFEGLKVILWFHPFIYYYEKKWQSLFPPQAFSNKHFFSIGGSLLLTSALLISLFSFNQSSKLINEQNFHSTGEWLNTYGDQTMWAVEESEKSFYSLRWGIKSLPLVSPNESEVIDYEIPLVHPKLFYTLQYTLPEMKGLLTPEIQEFSAQIALPNSTELLVFQDLEAFEKGLKKLGEVPECTVFLKIIDERNNNWFAACTISESGKVYGLDHIMSQHSKELAGIKWHIDSPDADNLLFKKDTCVFKWGDLSIDLIKYANPNVYSGYLELKKENLLPFLHDSIRILKDGEFLELTDLTLRYYDKANNEVINLTLILDGSDAYLRSAYKKRQISDMLNQGDAITIYGKAGDISLNAVSIRIYNPNSLYEPKVWFSSWKKPEETYEFQVISREGFKTKLRIDTTNQEVKHVLDLYDDPERYDIIHIPGFQTFRRLVHSDAQSYDIQAVKKYPDRDWFYRDQLPENLDYVNHLVQLRWGELFAMPNSEIYSPEEFLENIDQPIELWFDKKQVKIKRLAVAIIPKEGDPDFLLLDELAIQQFGKMEAIRNLEPATSLFISGMTFEDEEGNELRFPESFIFHIGYSLEEKDLFFQTEILETAPEEGPSKKWTPGHLEFKNYPLTELISELVNLKINRIEFEGLQKDPFLNITFEGDGYDEVDAKRMILSALQKKFHFSSYREGLHIDHFRIQVMDEPKLEAAQITDKIEESDRVKVFDQKGFHLLNGFTIPELADYLEDELDILITVFPFYDTEDRYIFGLDFSSFINVREQLKADYGIQLWDHNFLYNGMRVQFGGDF